MYGGTIREDPEYPGIFSIPRLYVWGDNSGSWIPGYLVFQTLSVRLYVWGDKSGGSRDTGMYGGTTREDPEDPRILSIPDTVSGILCMGGQLRRIPSIPGYLCEGVCMGAQLGRIPTLCV